MGDNVGALAMMAAVAVGAELVLIPEDFPKGGAVAAKKAVLAKLAQLALE